MPKRKCWPAAALMILAVLLYSCVPPDAVPATLPSPNRSLTTIPIPSPTPKPIPQVLLIADDPLAWEGDLTSWVVSSGWQLNMPNLASASTYLQESSLPIAAVSVQLRLDGDLESAATEGLPVVMVDVASVEPGPSLSTVGNSRHDQAGFLAGVMTGLASQTGWVGQVTATGGSEEAAYSAGFTQGLLWGCPKCRLISQTADEMTLDRFRANSVDVVFPIPGPAADEVAVVLADGGLPMVWVGENGPPSEALVGRLIFEEGRLVILALEELMITGEGQAWRPSIESNTLILVDINSEIFSPGRQRLLYEAYDAIAVGELDIGIDLDT